MVLLRPYRESVSRHRWGWILAIGALICCGAYWWPRWDVAAPFAASIARIASPAIGAVERLRAWLLGPHGADRQALHRLEEVLVVQRAALASMEELRRERDRLRALLELPVGEPVPTVTARVVAHDPRAMFKTILIDRGAANGVHKGMVAVTRGALVGRVEQVAERQATVLLLIDPNHVVDVWSQRNRARGLLVGSGYSAFLHRLAGVTKLEYLADEADLSVGDMLVTTGLDGRYPKGIPVGTVRTISRSEPGSYLEAEVLPLIDWAAIEEVALLP
ncbi:MAG: rod shape-determining protein MreC [Deltaproteobacteria bacterium]|nr:rod shape-determining protein MreC [Deltaproteobacteria bacterium]